MGNFIPVEPEKWAEMVKAAAVSDYWRIEAETDHARWLRTLEENEKLRAENDRLRKAGDAMYYNILTYKYHIPDNGNTHFMIDASILGWNPKYGQTTEYGKAKEGKQS